MSVVVTPAVAFEQVQSQFKRPNKPRRDVASPTTWSPDCTRILLLTQQGWSTSEISRQIKLSVDRVSKIRSSTYFIQKLTSLQMRTVEKITEKRSTSLATDKAREVLTKAALFAAKKIVKLGKEGTTDQRIQFDACRDILDRAGLRPIEVLETRQRVYSPEEVQHAKAILIETESIVKRLTTNSSPFVLTSHEEDKKDESSATEQAHAPQPIQEKSPDAPLGLFS